MQGYIVVPFSGIINTVEVVYKLTGCTDLLLRILAMNDLYTIPVSALILVLMGIVDRNLVASGYKAEG